MAVTADLPGAFPPNPPLAGEGAPPLLTALLAAMGATLAVVAVSMWLAPPSKVETIVVHEKEPAPPPKIIEVKVPAPAPPPQIIKVQEPAPPPPCFDPVTIMFARGKSVPLQGTDAERAALHDGITRLNGWLGKHAEAKLLIAGHADSAGTEETNLVLSFARSKAVSTLLVSNGIPATRLNVRAAGAAEAAAAADPRDRRVDVSVDGVAACNSAAGATEHK